MTLDPTCSEDAIQSSDCSKIQKLTLSLTGVPGNVSKVSIHDGVSCEEVKDVGHELFKQVRDCESRSEAMS